VGGLSLAILIASRLKGDEGVMTLTPRPALLAILEKGI
jgi:hypothetical protein